MLKKSVRFLSMALLTAILLAFPAVASDQVWTEVPLSQGAPDSSGTGTFTTQPPGYSAGGSHGQDYASDDLNSDLDGHNEGFAEGFDIQGNEPGTLYFGDQPVSYSTYRSIFAGANSLWIEGAGSWSQYVVCPLGGTIPLVATTPDHGVA